MRLLRVISAVVVGSVVVLTGCYKSTRLVQKTMPPEMFRTAGVESLKKIVSDRDASIRTLTASVLITASMGGGKTGQVTTYTPFKGYIFVRQPADLRVILQVPVLGSRAMDMVSDGKSFTMVHATAGSGDVWIEGSDVVSVPSKNSLENLRPNVFLDSLLVPGVTSDEYVAVTDSTRLVPLPDKKNQAIEEPDYDLAVMKLKSSNVFQTLRVIHINRINMLPYQLDVYNESGQIVTRAVYDQYKDFGGIQFPTVIDISRPLDELGLKVEITKLTLNEKLEDDQFELKVPEDAVVKKM